MTATYPSVAPDASFGQYVFHHEGVVVVAYLTHVPDSRIRRAPERTTRQVRE